MSAFMRHAGLAAMAGLIGLTGCGTATVGSPGGARSSSPPASPATTPASSPSSATPAVRPGVQQRGPTLVCSQPGSYLTSARTGRHSDYDRVVFEFSGRLPGFSVTRVKAVYQDPKGSQVPLAGQSYLRVIFHGTSTVCPPRQKTYTGPSVLTPYYPELLTVAAAGDFEGVLSFGVGLAAYGAYHVFTLAGPSRLVVDVSHVALGKFPGIWNITSWPKYWAMQYSWLTGHQPWLSSPSMVVEAWARGRYGTSAVIQKLNASTFMVTAPGGKVVTVTGIRPVTAPGPWVITKIAG